MGMHEFCEQNNKNLFKVIGKPISIKQKNKNNLVI